MSDNIAIKQAWVEQVLGYQFVSSKAPEPPQMNNAVVKLAQGLLLWNQTRAYVGRQLKTLQQAIIAQTQDEPDAAAIKANLGKLERVLELLDDRMTAQLNALRATSDPAEKQVISARARRLLADYETKAKTNALLNEIDDNGFVALDIKPRVIATLSAVRSVI